MSIECLQDVQVQLFAAGTKQAASLFDIGIWVVPRFIRPLQCFSVRDFFMHTGTRVGEEDSSLLDCAAPNNE